MAGGVAPISARGGTTKLVHHLTGVSAKQVSRPAGQLNEVMGESARPLSRPLKLERLEGDAQTTGLALPEPEPRAEAAGAVIRTGGPPFMFQTAARRKLEEMQGAHEGLQAESAALRRALDTARESQELEASLRKELEASLRGQLLEARAAGARQAAELEELRGRLSQAEQHAGGESGRLDSHLGSLRAEMDTLSGEVERLRCEGAVLQDENDVLKREHAAVVAERRALGDMLEEALRLRVADAARLDASVEEARRVAAEAHRAELDRQAAELDAARGLARELGLKVERLEAALKGDAAALRERKDHIEEEPDYVMQRRESESSLEHAAGAHKTLQREVELLRGQLLSQSYEAFQSRRKAEEDKQRLIGAKLVDAINQRVQLHICVPKTSVTYNNAPPFVANVADGLSPERIKQFLEREVFPHFEPLWARLDGLDLGPDDSSKKTYSRKMLGRLTDAVQAYIRKAQLSPADASQIDEGGSVMGRSATC